MGSSPITGSLLTRSAGTRLSALTAAAAAVIARHPSARAARNLPGDLAAARRQPLGAPAVAADRGQPAARLLPRPTRLLARAESPPPRLVGVAGGRRGGAPCCRASKASRAKLLPPSGCRQGRRAEVARVAVSLAAAPPKMAAKTKSAKSACFQGRCVEDVREPLCFTASLWKT